MQGKAALLDQLKRPEATTILLHQQAMIEKFGLDLLSRGYTSPSKASDLNPKPYALNSMP